ncbi:hypothetical protein [Reyranella sp.]|uniref:hypothetical protein n=1 Tax=Reyranella sp. TaxID=1929291 RepID=UPI003BA9BA84
MPLDLKIDPEAELCVIRGQRAVTLSEIEGYLSETVRQDVKGYAKLVDMSAATLDLDCEGLEEVARGLVRYGSDAAAGPVAIVVTDPLTLDMAVLLKQRVGDRPFRIFTSVGAANEWLQSYRETVRLPTMPNRAHRARSGLRTVGPARVPFRSHRQG